MSRKVYDGTTLRDSVRKVHGVPTTTGVPIVAPSGNFIDPETGQTWVTVFDQPFNTIVPKGSIWDSGGGGNLPSTNPYSYNYPGISTLQRVNCYEKTISTTSKKGFYYPSKTTEVREVEPGVTAFCIDCHMEVIPETGVMTPLGGTMVPRISGYWSRFLRTDVVYKINADPTRLINQGDVYGGVWQSINSDNWPEYMEDDGPENAAKNPLAWNLHPSSILRLGNNGPHDQNQDIHYTYNSASPIYLKDGWVRIVKQWQQVTQTSARLRHWVDNTGGGLQLIMDRTQYIGYWPLLWMFQCGDESYTDGGGTVYYPQQSTRVEYQIAYAKAWQQQNVLPLP